MNNKFHYNHLSLWGVFYSIIALAIGFILPLSIKHYFHDDSEAHHAFWITIELYSALSFLAFEKIFHCLEHITKNQEEDLNSTTETINNNINSNRELLTSEILKEFNLKLDSTLSIVSNSIAMQLKAEKTIMQIPLKNTESYQYIESILNLHSKVNETNKNDQVISFALTILKNSTLGLKNFFNSRGQGGLYRIKDAVLLYEQLSSSAKSITVIEPRYLDNYSTIYSTDYTMYIEKLALQQIKKKYVYLDDIGNGATLDWLNRNNFETKSVKVDGAKTYDDKLWSEHSHLLFGFDSYFISCSVLPLFDSDEAGEIDRNHLTTQNFKKAEYFYLAFRIIDSKNNIVSNGDTWFKHLIDYHNKN